MNKSILKETFAEEKREMYGTQTARIPLSHQGIARTDRIYLSEEMFQDYMTSTQYIGISTAIILSFPLTVSSSVQTTAEPMTTVSWR